MVLTKLWSSKLTEERLIWDIAELVVEKEAEENEKVRKGMPFWLVLMAQEFRWLERNSNTEKTLLSATTENGTCLL